MPANLDDVCTLTRIDDSIVKQLRFDWVSDTGDGSVDFEFYMSGLLRHAIFAPGAGGVQPTPAYDVTILSANGLAVDVLGGVGIDLDSAVTVHTIPHLKIEWVLADEQTHWAGCLWPMAVNGLHLLTIRNAGNGKEGSIVLVLTEPDPVTHRLTL